MARMRVGKALLSLGVISAAGIAALVLSDLTFWDRYLHARSFESFVEHPFPTIDRLYPQEVVRGAEQPRALPVAAPGELTIPADALARAASLAEASQSTSLLVWHRGRIQLERYWRGADQDTPVYSFSMHKSIIALLIGTAIAEGHIAGVDEPLATWLPEWADGPRARITIRHALQMNSGLEEMKFVANPFSKHVRRQIGTDLAGTALSFEHDKAPGTVFHYNGVNPTLLALVLERATGQRYADYLSSRLWRPLGNRDAAVWLDHEDGLVFGATSLFAVPMDWLRVGVMMLNEGRAGDRQVIPAAWLREMARPSDTNPLYGYLLWLGTSATRTLEAFEGFEAQAQKPFAADGIVYFDGLGGQRVYVVPSHDLIIVRTGVLAHEWNDTALPNVLIEGIDQSLVN